MPMILLAAQAATPERIDLLAPARRAPTCEEAGRADEVVVCSGRPDEYRIKPLYAPKAGPPIPKAETRVGPATAAVETEGASVGGFTSNRLMFRLKLPF